ncbi:polysaccharide lyase family 8 super-sandwich domain-containing protein [Clostridium haemolyticum]|uniref:Silent information regulator protein Sir2 n=1 Tax=Clostridium haemolyticum NCTC 9693 TaxID=1443114 RepID=A0ABR4TE78_CLOHA|nr:polysaccharide lyase family 8 super-sandwich domain-containing protein [Clostridium haemolyticum]KEI16602.1 silent information regulator protein Sir2 [Clostridium haemolyticum NCTC 9693]KGN03940.1 silent information regulator protein Sir2 [Clostridium haemolyticum NCTC 8350]
MNRKKILIFLTPLFLSSCFILCTANKVYGLENNINSIKINCSNNQKLNSLIPKSNFLVVEKNKTLQLPLDSKYSKKTIWESYNSDIVSVNNGTVKGLQKGSVIISATTPKNTTYYLVTVKYTLSPPKISKKEYSLLRQKWFNSIIGNNYNINNPNIKHLINSLSKNCKQHMSTINKDSSKKYLWNDIQDMKTLTPTERSANIVANYNRILNMTKAYVMPGSTLKGNADLLNSILYCLDWMYKNKYNENLNTEYGNWWSWEIGVPKILNDICILLYDNLDSNRLTKYMKAIYFYQPDPFHSGYTKLHPVPYRESKAANRVDVAKIALGMGILSEDSEEILMGKDALESLLHYVNTGDGFYSDGSFIQHNSVPYVGTYGNVFISGLLEANSILKNSSFEINKNKLNILYDFIKNSFEPFLYKGAVLDMVRGRAISRYKYTDRHSGHDIINSLLILCQSAEEPYLSHFRSLTKYLLKSDTLYNHLQNQTSVNIINYAEKLLNDSTITPLDESSFHKNFPLMDRVIHRRPNYLFGVSMFSSRISNYESMNSENKNGWHTTDGMTYLYNSDLTQYSDNFWPTINPYRIPGTTVDTIKMIPEKACGITSTKDWVGGVSLHNYGSNGMEFQGIAPTATPNLDPSQNYLSLTGKKSWFMFDKEIVCLGSGITSKDNGTIESIIENRKLKDDNSNIFNTNIGVKGNLINTEETLNDIKWCHLSGNTPNSDIGYYFPNNTSLKIRRIKNSGSWNNIGSSTPKNSYGKPIVFTKNYIEMWFDHGKNPNNASYSYVLLPNMSKNKVVSYCKNPDVDIIENTQTIHAVKQKKLNILCANFFNDCNQAVDYISVNKKSSIMVKESKDFIEIAVSDPTMQNKDTIEVILNKKLKNSLHLDDGVSIVNHGSNLKLSIKVLNSNGKTFYAKFSK